MDVKKFQQTIRETFGDYRDVRLLTQSPLAQSPAIMGCLLDGDSKVLYARGYAVRALLDWALDSLKAKGDKRSLDGYDVLDKRYRLGWSASAYADDALVSERTSQERRKAAIKRVSRILQPELTDGMHQRQYQQRMITYRYKACDAASQTVLRFLSLLRLPLPLSADPPIPLRNNLTQLTTSNLILVDEATQTITLQPTARLAISEFVIDAEARQWHQWAARFYENGVAHAEACHHWLASGQVEEAVNTLVTHARQLSIERVQTLLQQLAPVSLSSALQAQVRLVAGRIAMLTGDLDEALKQYQQALRTSNPFVKATAYFQMAHICSQQDIDESLAHYAACRRTLRDNHTDAGRQLLVRALIGEATVRVEQQSNIDRAKALLAEAEALLGSTTEGAWLARHSDWHNVQGLLCSSLGAFAVSAEHLWQAWQYAQEADDMVRAINTTHNLGNAYYYMGKLTKSRHYYEKSWRLAIQENNERMVALNQKGLGACAFYAEAYDEALAHYQAAHRYFQSNAYYFWQTSLCYDIAEAGVLANRPLLAKQHWDEGMLLAKQTGNEAFAKLLTQLQAQFCELADGLHDRQRRGLNYARQIGKITKRVYAEVNNCSDSSAEKELAKLVSKAFLQKHGQARATYYVLQTR